MKHFRIGTLPLLLFPALALSPLPLEADEGPKWLSDVEAARARSRAEKKPLFAVFR